MEHTTILKTRLAGEVYDYIKANKEEFDKHKGEWLREYAYLSVDDEDYLVQLSIKRKLKHEKQRPL